MAFPVVDGRTEEDAPRDEHELHHVVGARYRIEAELGKGGTAAVFSAYDEVSQRRVALKRVLPRSSPSDHRRSVELFEREFHTLAQLAHPRIVEVYDYGVDDEGPYYTMELLDGGDLQQLVPIDWQRACAFARDVCSGLSLLHSRRLVHRDVSTRNVRCTTDGLAKLIDFGAMVPMGQNKHVVVGTPPYIAPEVLRRMPLDARTDLYALGATLYYALSGRHAYPARALQDLTERWSSPPPRPSDLRAGIPAALDALVLDLLQLDVSARPESAAEVLARLAAIDGGAQGEQGLVAEAYLVTPMLVGREDDVALARRRTERALKGRGGVLLVKGGSGVGRSRFLDACVLDAKLDGAAVLRADADDALAGDFGVASALARAVVAAMPSIALDAAGANLDVLGHVAPELLRHDANAQPKSFANAERKRAELQPALREWLVEIARKRPLVVVVDDAHRIDEPSLAFVALLGQGLGQNAISVIVTAESGAAATSVPAMKLLADCATPITLGPLGRQNTEKLLASVFGDVPNLGLVAAHVFEVSAGNPRDTMRLAQHLLERGVVRYQGGEWTLPERFDPAEVPTSMSQALDARVQGLSPAALELAGAVALSAGLAVTFEECLGLTGHGQTRTLTESLDELVRTEIFRHAGSYYELSQRTWVSILDARFDDERRRQLHLRIAALCERREADQFRAGQHFIRGGELAKGVEVLAKQAEALEDGLRRSADDFSRFVQSLPSNWFETYHEAIQLCTALERPRKETYVLQSRLVALCSVGGTSDKVHRAALIAQLREESGLADWVALEGLDPGTRLMTALGKARARFESRPEHDRVLDPATAIRQLARTLIQVSAVLTSALDVAESRRLPSLAGFVPLSPALGVIEQVVAGMIARMTGRTEEAQAIYAKVLARTNEPDRAGLDDSHLVNTRFALMGGLGMMEAGMGLDSSLAWAAQIEAEPLYQVNAVQIRMLYHLWRGDAREAARCKREVDLLRIQRSARQFFEGTHLMWQIVAHASTADLTRTKQTIEEIDVLVRRYPGWLPVRHYGMGEYHRIRGDLPSALAELSAGLASTSAGEHQIWPNLAGAHLRSLSDSGQDALALELGEVYARDAEQAGLGQVRIHVSMPLAQVKARLGHGDEAVALADGVLERLRTMGATGVIVGLAHETRARVALSLNDTKGFERHAALFKQTFSAAANPALAAKFEKLHRDTRRADGEVAIFGPLETDVLSSRALATLDTCQGTAERAHCALQWLAQSTGAADGFLFLVSDDGTTCAARLGDEDPPEWLSSSAEDYVAASIAEKTTSAVSRSEPPAAAHTGEFEKGVSFRPVLLSHPTPHGLAVTGVAMLATPPGARVVYPPRLVAELSRRVELYGDARPLVAAG